MSEQDFKEQIENIIKSKNIVSEIIGLQFMEVPIVELMRKKVIRERTGPRLFCEKSPVGSYYKKLRMAKMLTKLAVARGVSISPLTVHKFENLIPVSDENKNKIINFLESY